MDGLIHKEKVQQIIKKYRYALVIVLVGVLLMCLPEEEEKKEIPEPLLVNEEISLQDSLGRILSMVDGAGKVEVLLTQKYGEQTLYQTDNEQSQSDTSRNQSRQTVLVEDSSRQKTGLVQQINPPVYQGAIIISQGADSASVRLSLVEAVMGATGLPSHCVKVLKMK